MSIQVRLVGEARFLKHDADLHPIGRRGGKELQPIGVLRRPARENRMIAVSTFGSHRSIVLEPELPPGREWQDLRRE